MRITSMTEALHQVTLYETYKRGNRDRNIRQLNTQETVDVEEREDDIEIRKVGGKRYVTEERLTQFERGMTDSIKESITQSINQSITQSKCTPSDVIGSADPSQAIGENIAIDRVRAATITVLLVINKVETKAVIHTGAEMTVLTRVRIKEAITIPANSEIIIAGEGYDTEGLSSRYSILEPVVEDSRKIMVARTLVDAHSCKVPVRLINLDEHPVKLRKNYLLGELHPVQDISEVIDLEEKKINRCGTSTNSCSIHSNHSVTLQDFLTDQGNKEAVKIPESWTESSEIRKISGAENDG
ncbi:unnamed protein product [Mytilus edulis]|uniref:Peptidase A2 domain-containing protein n=1 Tax=Mytilus edulis TaxID=6550 RepID=A0A8S3QML1_MYTED|nr:unnamed protein product [Mytilus edulis]